MQIFSGAVRREFPYELNGKRDVLDSLFYRGVVQSQKSHRRPQVDFGSKKSIYKDIIHEIEELMQKPLIRDFVDCIDTLANCDDRARIAISLVQNIPYDETENYRHSYGVLYDNTGDCYDKSILMIYLLKELGL